MNRPVHTRPMGHVVRAGADALGEAACGRRSSGGSSASSAPDCTAGSTPAAAASSQPSGGSTVDVTLKDFSITVTGGSKLAPGTYTFHVTNQGPSAHNLTVNGPGVSDQATPTFPAGTQDLTVKLEKGSYELFCSVPGH